MDAIVNVLSSIGFDWRVALANFVNFLIVLYLLNRFVFKAVRSALVERRQKIDQGLEDARKAETALQLAQETEAKVIKGAAIKANEIVAKAGERGEELVKKAEERGTKQSADLLAKAELEISEAKAQALKEAERVAVSLIVSGAEKILLAEVGDAKNPDFINRLLKEVKQNVG